MTSTLLRLAIAILLWASIPKVYAASCMDLMNSFLKTEKVTTNENAFSSWALLEARKLELDEAALKELKVKLNSLEKKPSRKEFKSYLLYLDSVRIKDKIQVIKELDQLTKPEANSRLMKKHKKIQRLIEKEKLKRTEQLTKKILTDHPGIPKEVLKTKISNEMGQHMINYERLTYGCRSTRWSPERKAAAQSFKKFTIGIGMVSSIGAYTYQNSDKEFDGMWFGRLGYELTVGVLTGLLSSRIISNPENTVVALALKKYFLSRTTGVVDMFAYGALFGVSNEDAEERLALILKDPKKREELEKLRKFMDDKNLYQEFKEKFIEKLKEFKESSEVTTKGSSEIFEPISGKSLDWNELTPEDLDDEEIQNMLLTAVSQQLYDEQKGDYIETGNAGSDRFVFHALYGAVLLPKDTFVSLYIYNTLCMGALNPKAALIKAVAVFTLNRLVFDQIYYYVRRTSINQ